MLSGPPWISPDRVGEQRLYMQVRGEAALDGFFAVPYKYVGSPPVIGAQETVRISVFPTTSVRVHSERPGDVISPDLLER